MKKLVFIFAFVFCILALSFVSPMTLQTSSSYDLGQNFIARVSGNFYQPLTTSNVNFLRGHDPVYFEPYYVTQIDNYNYVVSFTIPKGANPGPGNYTIVVQTQSGTVSAPFTITTKTAFASITPAVVVPSSSSYGLYVTNNLGSPITVSYGPSGNQTNSLNLGYQTSYLNLSTPSYGTLENMLFSYGNNTYYSLIYSKYVAAPTQNETNTTNQTGSQDSIPPTINKISIYASPNKTFIFNSNISDNVMLSSVFYSVYNSNSTIDNSLSNITFTNNKNTTVAVSNYGNYTLRVWAKDNSSNYAHKDIKFSVSENVTTNPPSFWDIFFGNNSSSNQTNKTNQTSNQTSFWDNLFGNNSSSNQTNETNQTTNLTNQTFGNTSSGLKTCAQLGFPVCDSNQSCQGSLVDASDAQCCNGTCVAQSSGSSTWGTIGWILLGIVILFLLWFFFFKFRKTRTGMVRIRR